MTIGNCPLTNPIGKFISIVGVCVIVRVCEAVFDVVGELVEDVVALEVGVWLANTTVMFNVLT